MIRAASLFAQVLSLISRRDFAISARPCAAGEMAAPGPAGARQPCAYVTLRHHGNCERWPSPADAPA